MSHEFITLYPAKQLESNSFPLLQVILIKKSTLAYATAPKFNLDRGVIQINPDSLFILILNRIKTSLDNGEGSERLFLAGEINPPVESPVYRGTAYL